MTSQYDPNSKQLTLKALDASKSPGQLRQAFGGQSALRQTLSYFTALDQRYGPVSAENGLFTSKTHPPQTMPRAFYETAISRWQKGERPSLVALAAAQLTHLGIPVGDETAMKSTSPELQALVRATILTAARAEMIKGQPPSTEAEKISNPYHNTVHTAHVATMALYHSGLHNRTASTEDVRLSLRDRLIHLIAAYAHDLDHPGHGNPAGLIYCNEENSFAAAKPILEAAGVAPEAISEIRLMIRATSPDGPSKALKEAVAAYHADLPPPLPQSLPELTPLLTDKRLCQMGALLTDADLFASAGAGLASNVVMTQRFQQEDDRARGLAAAPTGQSRDALTRLFLQYGVGDGFSSPAVRGAFNDYVSDLKKLYFGDGPPYPRDPAKPYTGPATPPTAP